MTHIGDGQPREADREAQPKLSIRLLERFEMRLENNQSLEAVLSKSQRGRVLMAFLILHKGSIVPNAELFEVLWPHKAIGNPESALKTMVSRLRAMLGEVHPSLRDCIQAHANAYSWNMELTREVDVFEVENACYKLLKISEPTPLFCSRLESLLCLYRGSFFAEIARGKWLMAQAAQINNLYRETLLHALDLFRIASDWDQTIKTCRMGLVALPFEERFHAELTHALLMQGRRNDAMVQHRHVVNLHRNMNRTPSSSRLQEVCLEIVEADNRLENDIDSVYRELTEGEDGNGAFVCDYAIFRDIYRLQIRSLERYSVSACLAVLKVNIAEDLARSMVLDEIMMKLLEVAKTCLRRGDTIARYTATQYAILLQGAPPGTVKSVLDRVKLMYYQELGHMATILDYRFMPLAVKKTE